MEAQPRGSDAGGTRVMMALEWSLSEELEAGLMIIMMMTLVIEMVIVMMLVMMLALEWLAAWRGRLD